MDSLTYLKKYLPEDKLQQGIKRLNNGEPVQYIVGNVDFFDLNFDVNKNVLIPRFETEELVDKTINYLKQYKNNPRIVDVGTGSGCIAITLQKKLNTEVEAVDISKEALEVARKNAKKNNASISFHLGNLLEPLKGKFTCVISNPPYISYDEEIMEIVKDNEPHIALYALNNGLYYYEEILKNVEPYLEDKALIAFEMGEKQGEAIKKKAKTYFPHCHTTVEKDLTNVDRFFFLFYERV